MELEQKYTGKALLPKGGVTCLGQGSLVVNSEGNTASSKSFLKGPGLRVR